jgi:hypothetical protein
VHQCVEKRGEGEPLSTGNQMLMYFSIGEFKKPINDPKAFGIRIVKCSVDITEKPH